MLGRIVKKDEAYHCVIYDKSYPIELDTEDKLNNGDLVQINIRNAKNISKVKKSELIVLQRITLGAKFFNIDESTPLIKRLENRILDLRRPANKTKFILRSAINRTLSKLFDDLGYLNVNTPVIVGPMVEGRVKTFPVNCFGKEAVLTMTKLVHLRYLICSDFQKVYDLSPVFVGGSHNTSSHVAEYYTFDWASSERIDFLSYIKSVDNVLSNLILTLFNLSSSLNLNIDFSFKDLQNDVKEGRVVSYGELMKEYLKTNPNDKDVLKQLHIPNRVVDFSHHRYGNYFWVTEFPIKFKQFYCSTVRRENNEVVLASELWWNGIKVASVNFSDSNYKKTLSRINTLGLMPKNFKVYLNAIKLASFEAHLGSLYIERLMMVLLKIDNMKETIMFPRATRGTVLDP